MCPGSRLKSTSWIFVATTVFSLLSCLAQETTNHREINSRDCSDLIYPNVNITSDPPNTDGNTTKRMKIHTPSVIVTCYEFYPIEWVFQHRLSGDEVLSLRERREWISSENGETFQFFFIDVTLNLTRDVHNITCRAVSPGEVCRQTTVTFVKNDINGINTTAATVYKGHPRGELLQQYSIAYEDNNLNCSLHIIYDYGHKRFECYSKSNDSTVSSVELNLLHGVLCYDPFSCGLLYNTNATNHCRNKFHKDTHFLQKTLRHYRPGLNINTGHATCSFSAAPHKSKQDTDDWQNISASSHFFQAKDSSCGERSFTIRHLFHTEVDPLSLSDEQHSDFILLCGLENSVFIIGHTLNVFCITSVYLFAEGVQMKIIMQNGSEINVTDISSSNEENLLEVKELGYYFYNTSIIVDNEEFSEIICLAPLRKSTRWAVKTETVRVQYREPLQFEGNTTETVLITPGSDVKLRCEARGNPSPNYEWKDNATGSAFPKEWVGFDGGDEVLTVPFGNISMLVGNTVLCVARNADEQIEKTFSFNIEHTMNSTLLDTSDYIENNWLAMGSIIAVTVLIVVGGTFAFLVWKMAHQRKTLRLLSQVEIEEFMNGNPGVLINSKSLSEYDINSCSSFLPYNQNFEVLKEQLELDMSTVIGSGAYGIVLKGILTVGNTEKVQVAVKTSKPTDDISYLKALMSELKIMAFIGKHDNIVNLLGAFTKNLQNNEMFIAIEYCDNGCLLNYLRSHRENFVDQTLLPSLNETDSSWQPDMLTTTALLKWCMQISNGMNFLCEKKVIHGDLAARNVLLSCNLTAKIGDFGLSRQLYEYANYIKKQHTPLPWKWLAIECHQEMKFSPQSDMWAYGITLWEIFTLGHSPFPGCLYDESFVDSLVEGKRPVQPQFATKEWYNLMSKCWVVNPSERPSFVDMTIFFDNAIRRITHEEYMNINSSSEMYSVLPVECKTMAHINMAEQSLEILPMDIINN